MDKYYARVCYNTNGWRLPSGDAAKFEVDSFVARHRFGYEEWLFNFTMWNINGYHYAFLQPVEDSFKTKRGRTIDVLLWTIDPDKRRVCVGEIKNCEVLSAARSRGVFEHHHQAKDWLSLMKKDLSSVNGTGADLSQDGLFNIRFRPKDAIQYDDPLPAAKSTDRILKLARYKLVAATESEVNAQWTIRTRKGSTTAPTALRAYP